MHSSSDRQQLLLPTNFCARWCYDYCLWRRIDTIYYCLADSSVNKSLATFAQFYHISGSILVQYMGKDQQAHKMLYAEIVCPVPLSPTPNASTYPTQSSSGGISSSIYRSKVILISVESLPRNKSLMKCASTCICTISRAPLRTPQKILEYHNSSCALPSSGSSTKSANGFSSKMSENCLLSLVQLVMIGVILRKILKPTYMKY